MKWRNLTNQSINKMKDKYYKTISPSLAKKRIAKLVERSQEAWDNYQSANKLAQNSLAEYWKKEWEICYRSLATMGITEYKITEE